VHIIGALRHRLFKQNDILQRMTWGLRTLRRSVAIRAPGRTRYRTAAYPGYAAMKPPERC
jgi:hypothetical protein